MRAASAGYGQIGYGCTPSEADLVCWKTPWRSLDSLPSFLIAACNYVEGSRDVAWGRTNYDKLAVWGREMFADDKDGNGLIEYLGTGNYGDRSQSYRRPANWWDTINFGHEDAFSNALAYRAATMFAALAKQLKHDADAQFFADKAAKLRAAYAPTFLIRNLPPFLKNRSSRLIKSPYFCDAGRFLPFRPPCVVEVGEGVDAVELAHEGSPRLAEAFDAFAVFKGCVLLCIAGVFSNDLLRPRSDRNHECKKGARRSVESDEVFLAPASMAA